MGFFIFIEYLYHISIHIYVHMSVKSIHDVGYVPFKRKLKHGEKYCTGDIHGKMTQKHGGCSGRSCLKWELYKPILKHG